MAEPSLRVVLGTKSAARDYLTKRRAFFVMPRYLASQLRNRAPRGYTFSSDRELITTLFSTTQRKGNVIVNYKLVLDSYDFLIAQIAEQLGLEYIVFCPNGSAFAELPQEEAPLLRNPPRVIIKESEEEEQYLIIANGARNLKPGQAAIVITPSLENTQRLKQYLEKKLDITIFTGEDWEKRFKEPSYTSLVISDIVTDQIYITRFNIGFIFAKVKEIDYSGLEVSRNRSKTEFDNYKALLAAKDSKGERVMYYFAAKLPTRQFRKFIPGSESYGAYLAVIRNNTKGLRLELEEEPLQILVELGILDTRFRLTDIGIAVNDSVGTDINSLAGLFFYYWKIEEKDIRFVYPGLVVTAFLITLPNIESNQDAPSVTTLSDFLDFWIEMTEVFPNGEFRNVGQVVGWAQTSYPQINSDDLHRLLSWLVKEIDVGTVIVSGKFTKVGLLKKAKPILSRVYYLFSALRQSPENVYLTTDGAFEADIEVEMLLYPQAEKYYQRVGVLRRTKGQSDPGNYLALVTIPLSAVVPNESLGATESRGRPLPPLPADIETPVQVRRDTVVPIALPFVNLVGSIPLK